MSISDDISGAVGSILALNTPTKFKRVSCALEYCLLLNEQDAWFSLPVVLKAHLSAPECATLAFMALKALETEDACRTALAALPDLTTGAPIAPLFGYMDEAAFWADMARPEELEAYCLACFNRMSAVRQHDFLNFIEGRAAA